MGVGEFFFAICATALPFFCVEHTPKPHPPHILFLFVPLHSLVFQSASFGTSHKISKLPLWRGKNLGRFRDLKTLRRVFTLMFVLPLTGDAEGTTLIFLLNIEISSHLHIFTI